MSGSSFLSPASAERDSGRAIFSCGRFFLNVVVTMKKMSRMARMSMSETMMTTGALRQVEKENPGRGVALQADENVPYRVIVRLFDAIREAGIRNLPAFTRPPGE
ncbi:MAG: biopolymer transporter ExbD, partial [Chthoniobacterales bacterium]